MRQWDLSDYNIVTSPMPGPYGIGALLKAVRSNPEVLQVRSCAAQAIRALLTIIESSADIVISTAVKIMTLPYYRLYYFNTTAPLERIALLASESPLDTAKVLRAISSWRARKLTELQFITISVRLLFF
jgi:hypothetical protein